MNPMSDDERVMAAALSIGRRRIGETAENPAVGALLVRDGIVIAQGFTERGGRPHAETMALAAAGEAARGATLYVTLEPCSHHGRTPPCAEAIVAAGVARVVSAMEDPDPRVADRGHAVLRAAGIKVLTGIGETQARQAHRGHILRVTQGRPMATLKLAETFDGFAAGTEHDARLAITGAHANGLTHMMRATHDAIMVGIGTARADDPLMTVRLPGLEARKPVRIVLDTQLKLSPRSRLAASARETPVLVIAGDGAPSDRARTLEAAGVDIAFVPAPGGRLDLAAALRLLGDRGHARIFSEGGPSIAAALIAAKLADEIVLFTAERPLGRPGVPALSAPARATLADATRYICTMDGLAGGDRLRRYERID
jgi:diaminohydroxyphosphoribosylaminopyrimidine deaminase/5-amino-6-(5-phosphoribosylamino)uracil reductase